jgi:hypothetical protein
VVTSGTQYAVNSFILPEAAVDPADPVLSWSIWVLRGERRWYMSDIIYLLPCMLLLLLVRPSGYELRTMQNDLDRLYQESRNDKADRERIELGAKSPMEGSAVLKLTKWLTLVCFAASLLLVGCTGGGTASATLAGNARPVQCAPQG